MLSGVTSAAHKNTATRCWLFERGQCRRGRSCRFLHVVEASSSSYRDESTVSDQDPSHAEAQTGLTSAKPCHHYVRTRWCRYGGNCRFAHTKTSATSETSSRGNDVKPEAATSIVSSVQNDGQIPTVEASSHGDNDAGMILIRSIVLTELCTTNYVWIVLRVFCAGFMSCIFFLYVFCSAFYCCEHVHRHCSVNCLLMY